VRGLRTFERRCFILDVDRAVLDRVRRPFPVEPIRTLDVVHLATSEMPGEPAPLVTVPPGTAASARMPKRLDI
jgi:hypothetical protein